MRCAAAVLLLIVGCNGTPKPAPQSPEAAAMFAPVSMRIHPIFTQMQDWTGNGRPDGVEALIEFQDQFGDPTKAAGRVIFELHTFHPHHADRRGERVTHPWVGSLQTVVQQRARWNRTSRTYTFQLEHPEIRRERTYVLSAWFDTGQTRFFDQIVLQSQSKESSVGAPATQPLAPEP